MQTHSPLVMVAVLLAVSSFAHRVSGAGDNSDCPLPDLLSGFASFNSSDLPIFPICDPDPQVFCAVSFEEGSVFYNGNTSNSTAFYTVSAAYCINSTSERKCEAGQWINEVILEKVATEDFLQVWNIVLIVIGGVAFVLGDAVAAGLGVYLALRSTKTTDKVLAIGMIVASVLIVLPVAGPVALITYIVLKKLGHDSKKGQLIHTTIKMIGKRRQPRQQPTTLVYRHNLPFH
jgi:hypothetical protein